MGIDFTPYLNPWIGRKVKIQSLDWYKEKGPYYRPEGEYFTSFSPERSKYCGMEATITKSTLAGFKLDVDNGEFWWTEWMLESYDNPWKP